VFGVHAAEVGLNCDQNGAKRIRVGKADRFSRKNPLPLHQGTGGMRSSEIDSEDIHCSSPLGLKIAMPAGSHTPCGATESGCGARRHNELQLRNFIFRNATLTVKEYYIIFVLSLKEHSLRPANTAYMQFDMQRRSPSNASKNHFAMRRMFAPKQMSRQLRHYKAPVETGYIRLTHKRTTKYYLMRQ
jgi:hypothetical protein